ncbi:DMT family transporter [Priestia flexa]|jgi:drug/metabolite transporter (DMT)-like permease|uniref:DMT family transporter n=1 Tax=Priestia flexa TaxID=86664 RepID=A0A8I1MHI6_9BACI|nr:MULTISPECIES: DMT family transporter [Priestia]MBN8253628.1 EamA family transporter [Priestia flexa]MBY6087862.1 DMT family transporter [Priestia flexa]MCE4093294.1 DMT family transporter [Priestia megaterium]MCP1191450.1 DMT family transporter [Priestia flexa]MDW8517034.1 DMT family transporter [Priestia flexa]
MKTFRYVGLLMIISGAALWGVSGPMIQWLFQNSSLTSSKFLIVRLLLAGIITLTLLYLTKKNIFGVWKHPRHWIQLIIFGILGMLGAQYAFIETIHVSTAVTAVLFQFLGPVLITIYVAIQTKKLPTAMQLLAVVSALMGTFFLITNGSVENIILSKEAITLGLLTTLGFTFYTLHPTSLIKEWGTVVIIGWGMLIGGVALFIYNQDFSVVHLAHSLTFSTLSILLLVIISGTLSFILYIGSLKYLNATETSLLSSIEPLVAAIVSMIWLNESFGIYQLLGGLLITTAVVFLSMPIERSKKKLKVE